MGDILKTRREIAYARELVANQRRVVERLKWEGADTTGAERALERYEQEQKALEDRLRTLGSG